MEQLKRLREEALKKEKLDNMSKYWDLFYKRNKDKFFKDRHWIESEFKLLIELFDSCEKETFSFLEAGCGVGNTLFPLIEKFNFCKYSCFDFSKEAIKILKQNKLYNPSNCNAFVFDMTKDGLTEYIKNNSIHAGTLIFVLSAIHPSKFKNAIMNIYKVLKTGGLLFFRDYALGDGAQKRFDSYNKIEENHYLRSDGTQSYFFSIDELKGLFSLCGFKVQTCEIVNMETINNKENLKIDRLFAQGVFVKT